MNKKIILALQGNILIAFALIFPLPIIYAAIFMQSRLFTIYFTVLGILTLTIGRTLMHFGRQHKQRLLLVESAFSILIAYPIIAVFGALPFLEILSPVDAALETVSNLTSAGISLLPNYAPPILRLWQSLLMWFGSLIFLVMLVTVMPEVSGSFGLELSLHGKQSFSPIFGQMELQARRVIKVYVALTILSVGLFKLAGLGDIDSLLMAMRCISTGGGDYFPARENIYVQFAAVVTMLAACGNFLFYYRLAIKIPPPVNNQQEKILRRGIDYLKQLAKNAVDNVKHFLRNSEVKTLVMIILISVLFVSFSTYSHGIIANGSEIFRHAVFHTVSFLSTTGLSLPTFEQVQDFDKFLIFLMAIIGGCMGSVTGGIKIVRLLVLLKITAAELTKTMHPRMLTSIRVNNLAVPTKIIGRILGFFFLACLTLFISSAVLSFAGLKFSEAVAMSVACLSNVGILPTICESGLYLSLSAAGKIFCMLILIIGRLEIFALLIVVASLFTRRNFKEW